MARRPLLQPPLLHDLGRFVQLDVFACDVATEELEFTAFVRAFKHFWRCAGEGCETLGVGEGLVEFSGCGAEFFRVGDGGGVDEGAFRAGLRCCGVGR